MTTPESPPKFILTPPPPPELSVLWDVADDHDGPKIVTAAGDTVLASSEWRVGGDDAPLDVRILHHIVEIHNAYVLKYQTP